MKITPQDIIDKEFRVKFRGFDMAEVDTFLEEVAENFFRLTEENTLLNEKVLALQQDLETINRTTPLGHAELPAELGNLLEDLKQDTTAIGSEIVALRQDRQIFNSLKNTLEKAIVSIRESSDAAGRQPQAEIPADLANTMQEFKQGTASIGAELASLQQKVDTISGIRQELKKELQQQLSSYFEDLDAKLSGFSDRAAPAAPAQKAVSPAPGKKEKLLAAEIAEEPEDREDTRLPKYRKKDDDDSGDDGLEFLSEDDILDVDKLRDVFQSVLDEDLSDGHDSRGGDDATADLLFFEDDLIGDEHEPEVTFSFDEEKAAPKTKLRKP